MGLVSHCHYFEKVPWFCLIQKKGEREKQHEKCMAAREERGERRERERERVSDEEAERKSEIERERGA